jgi:hypothetical protein
MIRASLAIALNSIRHQVIMPQQRAALRQKPLKL